MILNGIRVLDFTQYLAGPTVTRLMAEMGADIIKIERAPVGDPARLLPAIKDGRSGYFVQQNLGKRSLCVDLNHGDADALIHELVGKVDVVVENFGPGVMQRRGWDFDSLLKINPKLVMASVSAFGRTGPLAHKTGFDWIARRWSAAPSRRRHGRYLDRCARILVHWLCALSPRTHGRRAVHGHFDDRFPLSPP